MEEINVPTQLNSNSSEIILHIANFNEEQSRKVYLENKCDTLFIPSSFSQGEVTVSNTELSVKNMCKNRQHLMNKKTHGTPFTTNSRESKSPLAVMSDESQSDSSHSIVNNMNSLKNGLVDNQSVKFSSKKMFENGLEIENNTEQLKTTKLQTLSTTKLETSISKIKVMKRVSANNLKSVLKEIKRKKYLKKEGQNDKKLKTEKADIFKGKFDSQMKSRINTPVVLTDQVSIGNVVMKKKKSDRRKVFYQKETLICQSCGAILSSKDSLRQHKRRFHSEKIPLPPCSYCGKVFLLREDLRKHMNGMHSVSHKYVCDSCGTSFSRLQALKCHQLKQHGIGKQYKCEHCSKEFFTSSSLKRHYYIHESKAEPGVNIHGHEIKTFHTCDVCNLSFSALSSLKRHRKMIHYNERPFHCDFCGKAFGDSVSLKRHTNIHTHVQACYCNLCNKGFSMSSSLKRHMMFVHCLSNNGEYYCKVCLKMFKYRSSLKRHYLIHNDSKPYKCDFCEHTFRHITAKIRHMKLHSAYCTETTKASKSGEEEVTDKVGSESFGLEEIEVKSEYILEVYQ